MNSQSDFQDMALRALILAGGTIAAVLLLRQGQAQALVALAAGSTIGAVCMGRFGESEK